MPFVFPESKLALYPEEEIRLPTDQQPPKGMPPVAWSAYGELRNYADAAALNQSGAPGTVLPPDYVKELRRALPIAIRGRTSFPASSMDMTTSVPLAEADGETVRMCLMHSFSTCAGSSNLFCRRISCSMRLRSGCCFSGSWSR